MTAREVDAEDIEQPFLLGRPGFDRQRSVCVLADGLEDIAKLKRYRKTQRKLLAALCLAFIFMLVEVAGGIVAHSLAIITDAAHLLSDVSGFAVSAFAAYYAARKSHEHFSYGYHRVEVLGALVSILSVWLVTGILVFEAVKRVLRPEPVDGKIMFIIAAIGVGVNMALMAILGGHGHAHHGHSHSHDYSHSRPHSNVTADSGAALLPGSPDSEDSSHTHHHQDHEHAHAHAENGSHCSRAEDAAAVESHSHCHNGADSINMRGAIIHVLGDLVQSVGVMVAGAVIWYHQDDPRWALADPICTFLFAAVVLWTTLFILRDIADVLMERAPRGIKVQEVYQALVEMEGVEDVHDLHVWSLTPGIPLLCAHVEVTHGVDPGNVLHAITLYCRSHGMDHTTIQLVQNGGACPCGYLSSGTSRQGSQTVVASGSAAFE